MTPAPVLEIRNVSKRFGAIKALTDVTFALEKGEVHALCGENGAGKSTLMNIIAGVLQPNEGEILIDGASVKISSPAAAQSLGIGLVHQEIALCPDATVAENMFMATTNRRRSPFMNFARLEREAQAVMDRLAPIDVRQKVGDLPISSQQLVEIAKALTLDCRILIFDEPTAALTEAEAQVLFGIINDLKAHGISIVYISHRMAEIFSLCDRVTVFRDGRYVSTEHVSNITAEDVVRRMVGREITQLYPEKQSAAECTGESILSVRNLGDGKRFQDVSFELRKGEILGIGGLIGSGRTEIAEGICGLRRTTEGDIRLGDEALQVRSYADAVRAGVVYLSEDRKGSGVFLDLSIAQNIAALDLKSLTGPFGLLNAKLEAERAQDLARRLGVRMGGIDMPVSSLSGGNQQKVAIAKQLAVDPKVILMDEPTRGIDVGAKSEIHRLLRDLSRSGIGIVVITSELPELLGLCDRAIVIREGTVAGELEGAAMTEEAIMRLASGIGAGQHTTSKASEHAV
ncbi:sugar ABC transporter ATP-binding protein [Agrobacterium sp. SHOUNA12C]|uniref:sugar ABC transporter ATP-binding protein n=1 Tax=Rhizobium rhizogenes TaxID=359 RepID=UPI000646C1DA|nr:sugar ABC transporter ATP-binding protein [Rhizobium rhizogenes]KAA6476789.1 sugar ABC transporter ATP-binding protein [Agrobacterium sp. ICMP 7243]MCJ9720429.1 sugar ABC transporter ATP-binding protein [Agrobacterium sp. BETTINA12B]MCJ9757239.1 sugar ABC transporter ATP-binding protein [Agrobacterium sp. SHOUNA12C]NTF51646.1 sugar ABC transporter ATP-binding protein [Rhizobium rhizogenes]NTF58176.1 sugar ABC transporter ATP-binding protein [Rhizobium rhizogenes]